MKTFRGITYGEPEMMTVFWISNSKFGTILRHFRDRAIHEEKSTLDWVRRLNHILHLSLNLVRCGFLTLAIFRVLTDESAAT